MRVGYSIPIVVALVAGSMAAGVALPYDEQIRAELASRGVTIDD